MTEAKSFLVKNYRVDFTIFKIALMIDLIKNICFKTFNLYRVYFYKTHLVCGLPHSWDSCVWVDRKIILYLDGHCTLKIRTENPGANRMCKFISLENILQLKAFDCLTETKKSFILSCD